MNAEKKSLTRTLVGRVVSNKMDKTVTVLIERRVKHPLYGKYIVKSNKYHAHDETNALNEGDIVEIRGKRVTAAIAMAAYPEDDALDVVRLDGLQRGNAEAGSGEHVEIARPDFLALDAKMLPSPRADLFRAKGMPIIVATTGMPARPITSSATTTERNQRAMAKPPRAMTRARPMAIRALAKGPIMICSGGASSAMAIAPRCAATLAMRINWLRITPCSNRRIVVGRGLVIKPFFQPSGVKSRPMSAAGALCVRRPTET